MPEGDEQRTGMAEHPLRRTAVAEMHLRRWPPVTAPAMVIQWLRVCNQEERAAQRAELTDPASGLSFDHGAADVHLSGTVTPDVRFTWESHSEASSFTLFVSNAPDNWLYSPMPEPLATLVERAERLPGDVIRAGRTWIARDDAEVAAMLKHVPMKKEEMISCHVGGGARMWSDYRIQPDGYGRMLIAANGLAGAELSRLSQRLQELGNYRNLALIGHPTAKENWARLDRIELSLEAVARDQLRSDMTDDALLDRLSDLSFELMSISTATGFRMGATAAYAQLVEDRLEELQVSPVTGYPSLIDFTQRRFLPAVRTCAAFVRRENELSERASRFTSLLRARIETRIENQNGRLLRSMERSAAMQLRLQTLVEGLSVVALSYYTIGLLAYVLKGAEAAWPHFDPYEVIGIATIPIIIAIWLMLHAMKKRMLH